jgi:class 3 adenylate cyclase
VTTSPYKSLSDYLHSQSLNLDGNLDDGFGFRFSAKGKEIEATVLFADISSFSARTADMSPAETLIYVQNYFAWVTAEALAGRPGVIDKYIGDEVMVVFSKEFGSEDPFEDAIKAAAAMSRRDVHAYRPHIGIASGAVIVGVVGTEHKYDVSVFGAPVALAARCSAVKPLDEDQIFSSTITSPAAEWQGRDIDVVVEGNVTNYGTASDQESTRYFDLLDPHSTSMKGLGSVQVRQIVNTGLWAPTETAEQRAKAALAALADAKRYHPRFA